MKITISEMIWVEDENLFVNNPMSEQVDVEKHESFEKAVEAGIAFYKETI